MPLVDLKYTPKERKDEAGELKYEPPEYPWGLQIRLEQEELDKLGIKALPPVGEEFAFDVVARVISVSDNQYADGRRDCCVTLQVCQMGQDSDDAPAKKDPPASKSKEPSKGGVLGSY